MAAPARKSLLRRLRVPLALLLVLVVLLALAPQLLLPTVERAASETLHTPVDIGWLEVSPLGGRVSLRKVTIGEGGPLAIDRVSALPDLQLLARGQIELERVEIAGLRGTVEQDERGLPELRGLPFPEPGRAAEGPAVVVEEVVLSDIALEAHPPRRIREHPVQVHLEEMVARQVPTAAAGAAYQGELRGTLDGVPLTANARVDETPAGWRVEAEANLTGSPVDSRQFTLPPGLESLTATADGRATYLLDPQQKQDRLTLDVELTDLQLTGDEDTALAARSVTVRGLEANLSAGEVDLGRVTITAPRIAAAMTPIGLVYPGLVPQLVDAGVTSTTDPTAAPAWKVVGGRIDATKGEIEVRRDDHRVALDIASFSWRDVASGRAGELRLTVRGSEGGAIDVSGKLGIDPPTLDVRADVTSLDLPGLTGLLHLPLRIARGSASGHVEVAGDPARPRIALQLDASQLHTAPPSAAQPDRVLAVDRLETRLTVAPGPTGAVDVASLVLTYPYAMVQRDVQGVFPLDALTSPAPPPGAVPEATPAPAPTSAGEPHGPSRPVHIASLSITQGRIDFVDRTTQPPYWMGVASAEILGRGVRLAPRELDQLEASARQDELHPLRASTQRTGDRSWRGAASLEALSLPTLNPYLGPMLGYEAQSGALSVDVDATLERGRLTATSDVSLEDVALRQTGLDVIQQQTGVPLTVALSLLKDVGGETELSVPIEVDTATGRYALGSFVTQAIGRAVLGALSSPLRWLGMLFGTDGPPHALAIDPAPFAPGSGELDDAGTARVTQISRILAAHAELDVVLKAQIAEADRAVVGDDGLAALAAERVAAVRAAFESSRYGVPILPSRLLVAPWTSPRDGRLDPAPGVYVEVQSR